MAVETQPFDLVDFSGGITDSYIDAPTNRGQVYENLLLIRHSSNPSVGKFITRPGCNLYDEDYALVPTGVKRFENIYRFESNDLCFLEREVRTYTAGVGWSELQGPTGNSLFSTGTTVANTFSLAEWNGHLLVATDSYDRPAKIYVDGSSTFQLRTAGLPALASSPTITPGAAAGQNFIYRFVLEYTYTVGTVTYLDVGPVTEVSVTNAQAPNVSANAITLIPTLSNGLTTNWDTSNIKVGIYRTVNNGTVFYKVGEVTNGTASYNDTTSDATLITNERLYTEGGVVENDPPPLCKLVHVLKDVAYYAHIKDGTEIKKNEVRQSIPGDVDSVPEDFSATVQDEIVGISSCNELPLLICKRSVYRLEGQFDELGRGGMFPVKINDTATCVSSKSVVQTMDGVFWCGEDGFYWSDGYKVIKLNKQWPTTHRTLVDTDTKKRRVSGKYDRFNRRIWWTVQQDSGSPDCDSCVVLHLDFGISEESSFTIQTGDDSFSPSAIEFVDDYMLRGHRLGYLFKHEETEYNDLRVDTLTTPSDWQRLPILWTWRSVAFNHGTNYIRKWSTKVVFAAENRTNLSVQIVTINDDGRIISELKPIRFRGNLLWGDSEAVWGDPTIPWGVDGIILEQRRVPSNALRYSYKQIELTNAYVVVSSSDLIGTATVDATAKTVTLDDATEWPENLLDMDISFEEDDYTRQYRIVAQTTTVVTFQDADDNSIDGSKNWVIRGTPLSESIQILSITVPFAYLGQTHNTYTFSDSGEVGATD